MIFVNIKEFILFTIPTSDGNEKDELCNDFIKSEDDSSCMDWESVPYPEV